MNDLIYRKDAIDALGKRPIVWTDNDLYALGERNQYDIDRLAIETLPSAESDSCNGCKYLGQWENEVEYGYPSPCTRCKRRASDNYELRS